MVFPGKSARQRPGKYQCGQQGEVFPLLVVGDADAVHQRAVAAGAPIVLAIKDEDYGGRGFSCRDLEGHLWNIGTYDPWASPH